MWLGSSSLRSAYAVPVPSASPVPLDTGVHGQAPLQQLPLLAEQLHEERLTQAQLEAGLEGRVLVLTRRLSGGRIAVAIAGVTDEAGVQLSVHLVRGRADVEGLLAAFVGHEVISAGAIELGTDPVSLEELHQWGSEGLGREWLLCAQSQQDVLDRLDVGQSSLRNRAACVLLRSEVALLASLMLRRARTLH